MRFVKASERLPDDTKRPVPPPQIIVRWMYLGEYPRIDLMTPNQLADLVKNNVDPDYYEWLDESEQDEGWVPVEQFADFLDTERNKGLDGRGKESLWNDMKIWGKTTAFKLMLEKFKDRQSPATT